MSKQVKVALFGGLVLVEAENPHKVLHTPKTLADKKAYNANPTSYVKSVAAHNGWEIITPMENGKFLI